MKENEQKETIVYSDDEVLDILKEKLQKTCTVNTLCESLNILPFNLL